MAAKHDHHVVPQFYLRRFADGERMVREWSIDTQQGLLVSVRRATVVKDLYTIDDKHGAELDGFEDVFSRIESEAARALNEVLTDHRWPLNDKSRQQLSLWLSAQYLRTPRTRGFLEAQMNSLRSSLDQSSINGLRDEIRALGWTDKEIDIKWAETLDYYASEGPQRRNVHVGWFRSLVFDASKKLFERPWHLFRFDDPVLMTSDCPIVPIRENIREPGLHLLAAPLVHIPLDRFTLLQILPAKDNIQDGDDLLRQGAQELATMSNIMVIEHADRHTYEHPDDSIQDELNSRLLRRPSQ